MGNAGSPQTAESNSIGNAYLAKVLQGVKREVDSHIEIECNSSKEMYEQWKISIQNYKEKIKHIYNNDAETVINSLLFPSSTRYEESGSVCGDKQGKVVLEFSSGFLSLQESKSLHIQENMPYTSCQIWNLLFSMVEYHITIKRTGLLLDIRPESVYTDLRTKSIKLRNPFSFFSGNIKYKHEKYIDTQKLELVVRGLKVSKEIEEQNDAFNIGMILVQVMLLESCCLIYDDGLSHHKTINPTLHQMLIEKVLKLAYYPLKLRMVVAGLIQLDSRDRFTCEEIYALLKDSKDKIKNFHTFHLRKTSFVTIFKRKLNALEGKLDQIKQESNVDLFKDGLTFTLGSEGKPTKYPPYILNNSDHKNLSQLETPAGNMDQSLNFSMTHLAHTNRHQHDSLMLSKSDHKSSMIQQKESFKERSVLNSNFINSAEMIKNSQKSVQSLSIPLPAPLPLPVKAASVDKSVQAQQTPPQDLSDHQPHPQLSRTPDADISDPFDSFQQEKSKSKSNISEKSNRLSNSKMTPPRNPPPLQKTDLRSSSLKVQEECSQQLVTPQLRLSANLELIETEKKIKVETSKQNEEQISCISHKEKDPSDGLSRNSSVVQYVSELYQTERVPQPPQEATRTENAAQPREAREAPPAEGRQSWQSESGNRLFYSFEPQKLFIRKTESYEINSNSHSSIEAPREVMKQGSIIDRLAPLVKSKKALPEDTYKPDNLTDSARKRIQYWNTFSKFSPEVIAQLHLPARYPDAERLKRSMRETISYHNIAMSRTKRMFPEGERESQEGDSPNRASVD